MNLKELVNLCFYPKFPYVVLDEKNKVEISIGIENRTLFINFLGSVDKKDWIHDFMFWKSIMVKPYKKMKHIFFAHYGFLKIYKICRETIIEWAKKIDQYDKVIISGHSLGAGVGTLCCEEFGFMIEENIIPEKELIIVLTGAPKVFCFFNFKYIAKRCQNLIRVIYRNDLIPSLPFGYKHVGSVHQIGERKVNIFKPDCIYHHDPLPYMSLDENYISNNETNWNYKIAMKVYKKIYLVLKILGLIGFILLLIR
jgi:hypothetical protein